MNGMCFSPGDVDDVVYALHCSSRLFILRSRTNALQRRALTQGAVAGQMVRLVGGFKPGDRTNAAMMSAFACVRMEGLRTSGLK